MSNKIDLSIVIVSWNVRKLLEDCLNSLYKSKQNIIFEVIVVDNASQDGSAEMVRDKFPQVKLITNQINQGFARACNQGARISQGDFLLFLNDDTEIFDFTLDRCLDFYKTHQDLGVLGCSIKNKDLTQQPSVRRFPKLFDQTVILLKLHNFFPKLIKKYLCFDFDYRNTQEVEQVMGAFFLTKKNVFNKLQGFDENYFIWYEEVDYCFRVKNVLGLKIVYFADAEIIHFGGASFKQLRAWPEQKLLNRSLRYFFYKNRPYYQYYIILLLLPISMFLSGLVGLLEFLNLNPKTK